MRSLLAIKTKANARYTCQECGSTELIQAHHEIPGDDSALVALCADCHSARHPDMPKALFFNKRLQPYWQNKSASSLAKELSVCSRTVIRAALRLNITSGILSDRDSELIKINIPKLNWRPKEKSVKKVITRPAPGTFKVREFLVENGKVTTVVIDYDGTDKSILEWYASDSHIPKNEVERIKKAALVR